MMANWTNILYIIGAALMLWFLVRTIRGNPQAFSKENLSKSIYTIGLLTLFIIAIICICVLLLKST